MATPAGLKAAIAAAASYLEHARSPDRLWRDVDSPAGESADWVSGFVAYCAGSAGVLRGASAETMAALLRRQRPSGGWACNEQAPPDCGSTAWVLLAMSTATIVKPSMVFRTLSYVQRHAHDAGDATKHTCVSAVAAQALMLHGLARHAQVQAMLAGLARRQSQDGLWRSHGWRGNAYATAQALRALALGRQLTPNLWRRAAAGLMGQQQAGGGFGDANAPPHAFATAMALSALLTRPDRHCDHAAHAAARWLLDAQQGGHWTGVPMVRDQHGIFSTAAAMAALALYRDCLT